MSMKLVKNSKAWFDRNIKRIYLVVIIALLIITSIQTFLLINLTRAEPTSFLRFADYQLGVPDMKFDKKLGFSIPIEATLLSKTFTHKGVRKKGAHKKEFLAESKSIQKYLDDEENIVKVNIADKTDKEESLIILHFDVPITLNVSARTEDGENVPIVKKDKWKLLDISQFYANPNKTITIYLTADDSFYTYEYMFRLKIYFI